MKKCPKCGLDNIDSATKCLFCDTPFDESTIHNDEDLNFSNDSFQAKSNEKPIEAEIVEEKRDDSKTTEAKTDTEKELEKNNVNQTKSNDKNTNYLIISILLFISFLFNIGLGWTLVGVIVGTLLTIACVYFDFKNIKQKGLWLFNILTLGMVVVTIFNIVFLIIKQVI